MPKTNVEETAKSIKQGPVKDGKEYSFEVVDTCENLYIFKQKTYDEISKITGVPVVTIQRWSEKYEWRKKRLDQVKERIDYRKSLYTLRSKLLKDATENTDPQTIHAMAAVQRIIEAEEKAALSNDLPFDPGKETGLSEETLRKIKEEIYGISSKNTDRKDDTA